MLCYQCEQTSKGTGCTAFGVCGKDPETAALQDFLGEQTKGLAIWGDLARTQGVILREADVALVEALFTTVTNVNFDPQRVYQVIRHTAAMRDELRRRYETACAAAGVTPQQPDGPAILQPGDDIDAMIRAAEAFGVEARRQQFGADVAGLKELSVYGLKGAAAYADHAQVLGVADDAVFGGFHRLLAAVATTHDAGALTGLALEVGALNLTVMQLLDAANTGAYGHPVPTAVRVTPVAGKAILVSGHDLLDLEALLKQTAGMGVNIYTHGEMLPAHGYPELKKYPHLIGNYGGAWQDQQKEFDAFPGAILMTTNCIQKPRGSYMGRIFTSGLAAWPNVAHIADRNFAPVIEAALAAPGFAADEPEQTILVGFGHNAVLSVADKVIEAVKSGAIRRFFLIGGCDGAKSGRNYYTDIAKAVPQDCVILTLACGKYRFNKLDFGAIGGIPRLLDIGQCNDAYSAIQIAVALAKAFDTDVNSLPLSFILSWYEQKAVAILLTLLHLGIKNIKIGPSLPAFITPPVLDVLVKNYQLAPITTVDADLKAALG